jgi:replicative DNA helicase
VSSKIYSVKAELTVLRGMFHKDKSVVGTISSSVDESYFYREEAQEVYDHIRKSISEDGEVPKYKILLEDPALSPEAREYLRESQSTIADAKDAKKAVKVLNKYRMRRGLHSIAHNIENGLNSRSNLAQLMDDTADALTNVRATKSSQDAFLHFGKNNNTSEFVKDFIYAEEEDDMIPTGIKSYDEINGGFFRGSLVLLGGNSGAGKSHVAVALAVAMASMGYKVLLVPLEMSKKEMTARIIANIAKIDSLKLLRKTTSKEDKEKAYAKYRKWVKKMKAKGGRLTIFKPDADLTIEEVYAAISSYNVDVSIIDYISLLSGVGGDDQWRELGNAARYGKINAELTHRVNILLAQVSDDGRLKYSQTMREHASNMWTFVADKDTKEQGILKVEQPKSRNQVHFPFTLKIDYQYSRVYDVDTDHQEPDDKNKTELKNLASASPDV